MIYCLRLFVVEEINCLHTFKQVVSVLLNMTLFVGSQSFNSLPSFVFVGAAVSELREWNQNKKKQKEKNSEIGYVQFNTFPGHIIYPEVPFEHTYALLEVPYTTN